MNPLGLLLSDGIAAPSAQPNAIGAVIAEPASGQTTSFVDVAQSLPEATMFDGAVRTGDAAAPQGQIQIPGNAQAGGMALPAELQLAAMDEQLTPRSEILPNAVPVPVDVDTATGFAGKSPAAGDLPTGPKVPSPLPGQAPAPSPGTGPGAPSQGLSSAPNAIPETPAVTSDSSPRPPPTVPNALANLADGEVSNGDAAGRTVQGPALSENSGAPGRIAPGASLEQAATAEAASKASKTGSLRVEGAIATPGEQSAPKADPARTVDRPFAEARAASPPPLSRAAEVVFRPFVGGANAPAGFAERRVESVLPPSAQLGLPESAEASELPSPRTSPQSANSSSAENRVSVDPRSGGASVAPIRPEAQTTVPQVTAPLEAAEVDPITEPVRTADPGPLAKSAGATLSAEGATGLSGFNPRSAIDVETPRTRRDQAPSIDDTLPLETPKSGAFEIARGLPASASPVAIAAFAGAHAPLRDTRSDAAFTDLSGLGADPFAGEARGTDGSHRAGVPHPVHAAPELPRPALIQIVEAMRGGQSTIDVKLSPEELGRVTLSLGAQDGILNVVVQADRPETADLIRRSLDLLLAEARSQGFEDVSFSFGGSSGERSAEDGQDHQPLPATENSAAKDTDAATPIRSTNAAAGLDLRL